MTGGTPTGQPAPLGYEVAYEMLFATARESERALAVMIDEVESLGVLLRALQDKLKVAYTMAERTRGEMYTRQ